MRKQDMFLTYYQNFKSFSSIFFRYHCRQLEKYRFEKNAFKDSSIILQYNNILYIFCNIQAINYTYN